jgi:hypothetical protein
MRISVFLLLYLFAHKSICQVSLDLRGEEILNPGGTASRNRTSQRAVLAVTGAVRHCEHVRGPAGGAKQSPQGNANSNRPQRTASRNRTSQRAVLAVTVSP